MPLKKIISAVSLLVFVALPTLAHSGGTNADGCHTNRKTGEYHCHGKKAPKTTSPPVKKAPAEPEVKAKSIPGKQNGGNTRNDSFNDAKKMLLSQVYFDHLTTFYCDSPFKMDKTVTPSAKYKPKHANSRSKRIEWEHVVPAHAFGQAFKEWREGDAACTSNGKAFKGRDCASKVNMQFRYMESDMHNLVPAIGEINGNRSNYSYAMIPGEKREYGACDMEIENSKAEPAPHIRGNIARTYFYMDKAYPGRGVISSSSRKMFEAWDRLDPVDAWECERNKRIKAIQGNGNLFVEEHCL